MQDSKLINTISDINENIYTDTLSMSGQYRLNIYIMLMTIGLHSLRLSAFYVDKDSAHMDGNISLIFGT